MSGKDSCIGFAKRGRTAVRIAGEGEEQTPLEGRGVPLGYLFAPGIRQEHLRRTCRTSQTLAHPFTVQSTTLSLFGRVISSGIPGRNPGEGNVTQQKQNRVSLHKHKTKVKLP